MELSAWLAENGLSKVDPTMLTAEFGVEEADDLLHLEEPEIVQFTATLKPVQRSKFKKGLAQLGNGAVAGLMTPVPRVVAASASITPAAASSPAQAAPPAAPAPAPAVPTVAAAPELVVQVAELKPEPEPAAATASAAEPLVCVAPAVATAMIEVAIGGMATHAFSPGDVALGLETCTTDGGKIRIRTAEGWVSRVASDGSVLFRLASEPEPPPPAPPPAPSQPAVAAGPPPVGTPPAVLPIDPWAVKPRAGSKSSGGGGEDGTEAGDRASVANVPFSALFEQLDQSLSRADELKPYSCKVTGSECVEGRSPLRKLYVVYHVSLQPVLFFFILPTALVSLAQQVNLRPVKAVAVSQITILWGPKAGPCVQYDVSKRFSEFIQLDRSERPIRCCRPAAAAAAAPHHTSLFPKTVGHALATDGDVETPTEERGGAAERQYWHWLGRSGR